MKVLDKEAFFEDLRQLMVKYNVKAIYPNKYEKLSVEFSDDTYEYMVYEFRLSDDGTKVEVPPYG